jgi:peptide-methionine (R)-S-oxide reductase
MFDQAKDDPTRRRVLWVTPLVLGAAGLVWFRRNVLTPETVPGSETGEQVSIVKFGDRGQNLGLMSVKKVVRSDADWFARLTPQQYYVTRKHSTDMPYTGTYYLLHQQGLFRCICCDNALFRSDDKYDSGTGWPAFSAPIAKENVRTLDAPGASLDSGIEVLCKECDAHLGHIFSDGPPPTLLRYCINESSLRFVPA